MSEEPRLPDESPAGQLSRLWRQGASPELRRFLATLGPLPLKELLSVILVDQRQRWEAGERVPAEGYLSAFPELGNDPEPPVEVVYAEYLLREALGEAPELADYQQRFPQHARRLDEQVQLHLALGKFSTPGLPAHRRTPLIPGPELLVIPGYEILGELGRGGMGVVYKARQISLNRLVALKFLRTGAQADADERARFQAEAEAVARLQHTNIVQIHEVGQHQDIPFFSMELVEGGNLHQRVQDAPQPGRPAAVLVAVLADALAHAHQRGVLHRDLKPLNVLLTPDGTPRVTDFGLARRLDAPLGLTGTNVLLGTPSYMAPEQVEGHKNLGPAADVYGLGAILYECLTGKPPFLAESTLHTVQQVLANEPVPPSQIQPRVARDLETICLKCLRKEPEKRYSTATELAEDLRRFLAGEPIQARPVGPAERLLKWARRRPTIAALSLTVLLVSLLGFGGILWKWQEEIVARSNAEQAEQTAIAEALRAGQAEEKAEILLTFHGVARAEHEWLSGNVAGAERALLDCPPRWRCWEWRYLRRLCRPKHRSFPVVNEGPGAATFSPGGDFFAAVDGKKVRVWEVATGKQIRSVPGLAGPGLSGNGRLGTAYRDQIPVWDLSTRTPIALLGGEGVLTWADNRDLRMFQLRHVAIALTRDGQLLASASREGEVLPVGVVRPEDIKRLPSEVKIWGIETRKALRSLGGHTGPIFSLAFSPDGKHLATGSRGEVDQGPFGRPGEQKGRPGEVKVWEVRRGVLLATLKPLYNARGLCFSPDGQLLAVAEDEQAIRVWQWSTNRTAILRGHGGNVTSLAFSPDQSRLASASEDHTVKVWDVRSGRELFALRGHPGPVQAVTFLAGGKELASAGAREMKVWPADPPEVLRLVGHQGAVAGVVFSRDGKTLVSGGRADQKVLVWDVPGRRVRQTLQARLQPIDLGKGATIPARGMVTGVALTPDGNRVVSANGEFNWFAQVDVWNARDGKEVSTIRGAPGTLASSALSADGKRLATAGGGGRVLVRDLETGKEIAHLRSDWLLAASLCFSPDGRLLAGGNRELRGRGQVKVWDLESGQVLLTRPAECSWVFALAFSPDGRHLAWAGGGYRDPNRQGEIALWDLKGKKGLPAHRGHTAPVHALAFHPTEPRLVSGGRDGSLRLWDLRSGREVMVFRGRSPILGVAFSGDGRLLASGLENGLIEVREAN